MDDAGTSVAIVGLSGRFPGAPDVESFWDLLRDGREAIRPLTDEEFAAASRISDLTSDPGYVRATSMLEGIDLFDAEFFDYNHQQASQLDPQHRHFLECAWLALEDAACDPARFDGAIGVFASSGADLYSAPDAAAPSIDLIGGYQQALAREKDFLATRVSYKLDLRGPSITVQTACSSSLVAVHIACQNLLLQECDVALAGGVSFRLPQATGYKWYEGGILAPDGHCRAFDAVAKGTVPGSGVALVALQRLDDALRDKRRIYAVIRASAVNNDGANKVGFTAPSVHGQVQALRIAHAGLDPQRLGLIEAHGTGTELGDAIELKALAQLFDGIDAAEPFCALGSAKSNVGHLDAAAGATGLIKAALCLEREMIAPTLHAQTPNAALKDAPALYLATSARPWPRQIEPRRAAVSSFGIGGTNAHVVLEEGPREPAATIEASSHVFPLSARTPSALREMSRRLAVHLQRDPQICLADVAWTLQTGRRAFQVRAAVTADDREGLVSGLLAEAAQDRPVPVARENASHLVLVIPGDPAACLAAARRLLAQNAPAFRVTVDEIVGGLDPAHRQFAAPAGSELFGGELAARECDAFLAQLCLATFYARAAPELKGVIGFGLGQLVAACVAGAVKIADAVALLQAREAGERSAERAWSATVRLSEPAWRLFSARTGRLIPGGAAHALARAKGPDRNEPVIVKQLAASGERPVSLFATADTSAPSLQAAARHLVAELWRGGASVDWASVGAIDGRLTGLPGYPLERRPYGPEGASPPPTPEPRPSQRLPMEDWFNAPAWRTPLVRARNPETGVYGSCLILAADESLGGALAVSLAAAGRSTGALVQGDWRSIAADRIQLNLLNEKELERGLKELIARVGEPTQIVVVCDACATRAGAGPKPTYSTDARLVVAAAAALGRERSLDVRVVTRGATAAPGDVASDFRRGALCGLMAVLQGECPNLRFGLIDLPQHPGGPQEIGALARQIGGPPMGAVVALRGGRALVRGSQRIRITAGDGPILEPGAVCLITGGLGFIGLRLAEHLLQTCQARLVLTSKSALPPRESWGAYMSGPLAGSPFAEKLRRVLALQESSSVIVASADAADAHAMRTLVTDVEARWGPVRNLFHLAANLADGSANTGFGSLGASAFETQARPKVGGLSVLNDIFRGHELDAAVLFSSTSAWLGGAGRGAYAAFNACLDLAAESGGEPNWLSIAWDGWAAGRGWDDNTLTLDEGMEALDRILLARPARYVIVSATPLDARIHERTTTEPTPAAAAERRPRPQLAVDYLAPRTDLERQIASIWEEVLGIHGVGVDDHLFELGGDSLTAMNILALVHEAFEVEVPLRSFVEATPTIRHICVVLIAELAESAGDNQLVAALTA